jgi:ABC-2 type transport system permease protein
VTRYLRLFALAVRTSLLLGLQYRWDFLVQGLMQVCWMALSAMPLFIAYGARAGATDTALTSASIGGWGFYPAVIVFGFFMLLKAILEGAINPSLSAVVEHIRSGTLDFVLLKPADAQFLVSTARFDPWHVIDALAALLLVIYGVVKNAASPGGALPGVSAVVAAAALFVCGVLILYSIWILVICAAFYVVKVDNLSFLFTSVFDFARWPRSVFRGALLVLFTYVIPLVLMTSLPADALSGRLTFSQALWALSITALLIVASRLVWRGAIGRYTSASS